MIALFQFNIAKMREPYDHPMWNQWKKLVPVIHEQVKAAHGFMGHYDGTETGPGYIMPYKHDPLILGNLSAWESPEQLKEFTFSEPHATLLRWRRDWFEPTPKPYNVLYWDDKIHLSKAVYKLRKLRWYGADNEVFTWKEMG